MNETNYRSPMEWFKDEWEALTPNEKAVCFSYLRALKGNQPVSKGLVIEMNKIHDKHPDFHVGCIPEKTA